MGQGAGTGRGSILPVDRHRASAGGGDAIEDWPGRAIGVRAPYPGETALSWHEVSFGVACGALRP